MANEFDNEFFMLVDDKGKESKFMLRLRAEFEGNEYFALVPAEKNPDFEEDEYVILRLEPIEGSDEDDDEFERVADFFDDILFGGEIDYDESSDT